MATNLRPDAAACSPALVTAIVTPSDADQSFVLKSVQNMDTSPATLKLRNAKNDSDVTVVLPAWGRVDGFYSRVWITGSTFVAGKVLGFYDS